MGLYLDKKRIERIINTRKKIVTKDTDPSNKTIITKEDFEKMCEQKKRENGIFNPPPDKIFYRDHVFQNHQFNECEFQKIEFYNCRFISCYFRSCSFKDVTFNNCHFCEELDDPIAKDPSFIIDINRVNGCFFDKTSFTNVSFYHGSIAFSIFLDTVFGYAQFSYMSIKYSVFYACGFTCFFIDPDIANTSFLNTKRFLFDLYKTNDHSIDRFTIFHCAKLKEGDNDERLYKERCLTYSAISELYMKLGYTDRSAEYDYHAKRNEGESYTGVDRIRSRLIDALCGFGERPSHTFICIVLSILLFGIFYLFSGFATNERVINGMTVLSTWPSLIGIIKLYCHSVFFSVTTFSTVGYGNYVPIGAISSTLAAIQMLMGVSLTALWTGCIFRKIAR